MPLKSTHDQDEVIARQNPKTKPNFRDRLESGILQRVQNDIQETLLLQAPEAWADERLDQIEKLVLDGTRASVAGSTIEELRSDGALRTHITQAVAETRSLIHDFQKSLNKWAYPDDPELTTLPIMLTLDNEDWATIDATIQRFQPDLKDREHFVEKAVGYALDSLREEAATAASKPKRKGRKK